MMAYYKAILISLVIGLTIMVMFSAEAKANVGISSAADR